MRRHFRTIGRGAARMPRSGPEANYSLRRSGNIIGIAVLAAAPTLCNVTAENWCSELDRRFAGKVRLALWERYGHKHID